MFYEPSVGNADAVLGLIEQHYALLPDPGENCLQSCTRSFALTVSQRNTGDTSNSILHDSPDFGQQQHLPPSIHDPTIFDTELRIPSLEDVTGDQFHVFGEGDNDSAFLHGGAFESLDSRPVFDFSAPAMIRSTSTVDEMPTSQAGGTQPAEATSIGPRATNISPHPQGDPSQGVATVNQQNEPLRNNEGEMICRHERCEGKAFDRKINWK
jgi:hypothetical protein